ncbi:sensor histidine kinase [Nocardioides marmoraquaticus]
MTALLAATVAGSLVVPAVLLLVRGCARVAAASMLIAGAALVVASRGGPVGEVAGTLVSLLLAPLVVLTYPRARVREPLDALVLLTVVGASTLALLWPEATDAMLLTVLLVVVAHVGWSLVRSTGAERRSVTWLALALGSGLLASLVVAFALSGADTASPWALLPLGVVGPALVVGVRLPEVADARTLVVDGVAHAAAALTVLALVVGVGAPALEALPQWQALSLLGLTAAALGAAYAPGQRLLRATVGELVGVRSEPLAAVGLVTRSLGEDPSESLDAVRRALAVPWAAVLGEPPLTSGRRPGETVRVWLGEDLPELEVGLRDGDTRLGRADERLLSLAGPLLGQALRLHALSEQVSRSRADTVLALQDERRRLRRDLHDGLGPLLSGLALTTDAARNLLRHDPDAAGALLATVREQADSALDDVRRLVYGLRPPALDELGLLGALRQALGQLAVPALVTGEALDLPAAVEVAAYRIVVEAATNAARHAPGSAVRVTLTARGDGLEVEVVDDGGCCAAWTPGVGLESMRERAAEVGGTLEAGPTPTGGAVRACLPPTPRAGSSSTSG